MKEALDGNSMHTRIFQGKSINQHCRFVRLYEKYPNAKWFIMIDDDTFLLLPNLNILLEQFSPDEEHYFGSDTMFKGCDNVQNFGEGPSFAHGKENCQHAGGSGIVISSGAMKKMYQNADACIKKYKDCWAGDVRTALCLRDLGILLKGKKHFNKEPPNAEFWYPTDPCERPITFHHLLLHQMQRVHQASKLAAQRKLKSDPSTIFFSDLYAIGPTYGDIYAEFHRDYRLGAFDENSNRQGGDYNNLDAKSAKECQQLCMNEKKCLAWSFVDSRCWLKDSIPAAKQQQGTTTGTFPEKYVCDK